MVGCEFQSSFELTSYITNIDVALFSVAAVSKLFRAYELYNKQKGEKDMKNFNCFKALSSLRVI